MIGFIAPYILTTRDYRQYSATVIYTLYGSPLRTHQVSVFTSRILATDLSQSLCNFKSHMRSSFHSLIPSLSLFSTQFNSCVPKLISRQAGVPKLYSSFHSMPLNTSLWPLYTDHAENTAFIVKEGCLPICCLAVAVLLLRVLTPAGMCLPSRYLAMGIHVTIHRCVW
jgi:hypothetical protein